MVTRFSKQTSPTKQIPEICPWGRKFIQIQKQPTKRIDQKRSGLFFFMAFSSLFPREHLQKQWSLYYHLENIVCNFFRQQWLVLGVKLMEINSTPNKALRGEIPQTSPYICIKFDPPKMGHWLVVEPPLWKICSSNWIMKPQGSGWT